MTRTSTRDGVLRAAAAGFAALFVVGAAVQWNDPDPIAWIAAYLVAAALSTAAALGRWLLEPCAVAAVVFAVWFATLAPSLAGAPSAAFSSFEMQAAAHEAPREAAGLALLTVWNATLAIVAARRRRADTGAVGE